MPIRQFVKQENINMIWEVISDEEIFQFLSRDIQGSIYNLFINNIQGFFDTEKTKTTSLVEINKKYILLILNNIKKTYPIQPNKIKIHNDSQSKDLITYEEISDNKKSQFENDYNKRQEDFEDAMTIKAPSVPEFADKKTDKPIKEMDKILKEMQSQRNYEVEQINRNYSNTTQIDNWLKPKETSLKNEKININIDDNNKKLDEKPYSRFKYLNNFDAELSPKEKKVSFSNENEINTFNADDEEDNNIFSKLKKSDNIIINNNKNNDNINLNIQEYPEDRLVKLERCVDRLMSNMDKILEMLNK
jgi:hypothetical protein